MPCNKLIKFLNKYSLETKLGLQTLLLPENKDTIENMLDNLEFLEPSRLQKALGVGQSDALLSKKLATIVDDIPDLRLPMVDASFNSYDKTKVTRYFKELMSGIDWTPLMQTYKNIMIRHIKLLP